MSKYELRPHQKLAVKDIFAELGNSDRATYVSATGTGKTISLQHMAENSGNKIVAFFPSIMLVSQTILEWRRQYGKEIRVVAVCSDETVGNPAREDHMEVSDDELRADGAEVTRDTARIAEILKEDSNVPLVVFSTYHSANKVIDAQELCGIYFDLMVSDEAHYLAGRSALGRGILDSEKLLAKKRVFATATPKIVTLKQNTAEVGRSVVSMDEEELFGKHAHTYGLRDAIKDGILSDYKIYIVSITKDTLFNLTGKTELKPAELRMALGLAAYERMEIDLGVKRSVVYLSNKSRAREFARSSKGNVSVITGEMPSVDRNKKLDVLRNSGGGIANVRCLTEGIDLPALDAVEFVDPRSSKIDIVQAVGRALRRSPGKEFGYVIIPVLEEPNGEDYGSGDTFKHVWSVLAQMAENDTKLSSEINAGYIKKFGVDGEDRNIRTLEQETSVINISIDGTKIISNSLADELVEKIKLRSASINDPLGFTWRSNVDRLVEVTKELGRLPKNKEELSMFLHEQRRSSKGESKNRISKTRLDYLDEVLPGWRSTSFDYKFQKDVLDIKNRISEAGRFPKTGEYGFSFLSRQRQLKKGTSNNETLSKEREDFLNKHVPEWWSNYVREENTGVEKEATTVSKRDQKWYANVDKLKRVSDSLGRLPVSGEPMSEFLLTQRRVKKGKEGLISFKKGGILTEEREEYLTKQVPNWYYLQDPEVKFKENVLELVKTTETLGRFPRLKENNGLFLSNIRQAKKGKSSYKWTKEREDFMNEHLPGWDLPAKEGRLVYLASIRKKLEEN